MAMARSHCKQPEFSLAKIAIFAALPADALERIQNCCSRRRYESGEPIVEYLDDSDDVFFIAAGEVRVTLYSSRGRIVNLRDLGAGEAFGEYPAIDGGPRSASVEARTRCDVTSMPAGSFQELLAAEPRVAQGKSARIIPAPTHVEIASRVSTHREAVTRELTRLCRIGIAERQCSALLVKDIERLAEMVHEATGE
jgi:CRP/FNR family transcriptional regulator, cyclic AMP receptor protein